MERERIPGQFDATDAASTAPGAGAVPPDAFDEEQEFTLRSSRFQLMERLGAGSFGAVWRAFDTVLKRVVALKFPRDGGRSPARAAEFLAEARSVAKLRHAAIVQVYDIGEEGGTVYIASEYIDGGSLRDRLRQGAMAPRDAAAICFQLADALRHAHEQGILHRDLKPANVLLGESSKPYLADFGLAHCERDAAQPLGSESLVGTLPYMPPEQIDGGLEGTDARCDVYSLGVVLFEMLTRQRPFQGQGRDLVEEIRDRAPPRPSRLAPAVPRDLEAVCLKCLQKSPARRYATAEALADDLRRFLQGRPVAARPVSMPVRVWKASRRHPLAAGLAGLVALLLAMLLVGSLYHSWRSDQLLQESESNLREAERSLYYSNIGLARQCWQDNDMDQFRSLLNDCPVRMRNWEWGFLAGLPRANRAVLERAGAAVAYSPDGSTIATVGRNASVKAWNAESRESLFALRPRAGPASCLAFSPDGAMLATAGANDAVVLVWDLKKRRVAKTLTGHARTIVALGYFPDGRRVVSAGTDRTVRVWDIDSGKETLRLSHGETLSGVAVSADGKHIATGAGRRERAVVRLWDADSGKLLWSARPATSRVAVAFTPDSKRLAVAEARGPVRFLQLDAPQQTLVLPTTCGQPPRLAFNSDGSELATNHFDGSLRIWDPSTGRELRTLAGQNAAVLSIAYRPGKPQIAVATNQGYVYVHDCAAEPGAVLLAGHSRGVAGLDFSPDGQWLVSAGLDGAARRWDLATGAGGALAPTSNLPMRCAAYSGDGEYVACGGDDAKVRIWDAASGSLVATVEDHSRPVEAVAFAPSGRWGVSAGRDRVVRLWESATGRAIRTIPVESREIRGLAVSPCGGWIASVGRHQVVDVWHAETGRKEFSRYLPHPANSVVFSPDGEVIAATTSDGAAHFWRFRQDTLHSRSMKRMDRSRTGLAFGMGGTRQVWAVQRDGVYLCDAANDRPLLMLQDSQDVAGVVAFSPCGRHIAAAMAGGNIKVWSNLLAPGERVRSILADNPAQPDDNEDATDTLLEDDPAE